jgi:hypothetical protein
MPIPESLTRNTTSLPSRAALNEISPPGSVYFAEFTNKFDSTCSRRYGSASSSSFSRGTVKCSTWPRDENNESFASATRVMISPASTIDFCSCTRPLVIRDTSNRSSTRRFISVACCRIIVSASSNDASLGSSSRVSSPALVIAASGLRSSCPNIARNSSLRRSPSRMV